MTTHYEFTGDGVVDVMPDVERITAQAVADGRPYHVSMRRCGHEVAAVVTVYAKPLMSVEDARRRWHDVCESMNRGSWTGSEADALAEIERCKAIIEEAAA